MRRKSADHVMSGLLRSRFVITTRSGETWAGLLLDADEHTLHLVDVATFGGDGKPHGVDGALLLPRSEVAYAQRVERGGTR